MICYKDRTFCNNRKCRKFNTCKIALTDKVKEDANKWWNSFKTEEDASISIYTNVQECFEEGEII